MLVDAKPGTIATIAGNGKPSYGGDGGIGPAAGLNEPKNIALDRAGNLYIADAENHLIRKVEVDTGRISAVAGHPAEDQPHERADAGAGALDRPTGEDVLGWSESMTPEKFAHLADLSGTVRFVVGSAFGSERFEGDGGPAIRASLNFPSAVAVDDQGHLYIADTRNHRVRKVDAMTGVITTIAGTGQHRFSGDGGSAISAALNEPSALAVSPDGQLYIADQSNNRVRKVDLATGIIVTIAGTGEASYSGDGMAASAAALSGPSGLAVGPDGALYIADTFNGRVRMVEPETGMIRTIAGDGGEYRYQGLANEFSTSLSRPYGIAVDGDGNLLITDSDSHLIRQWRRSQNIIVRLAGNGMADFGGDGGPAMDSRLNYPFGVAVDGRGNIYVADTFNHRIRVIAC
ncbi:MAG: NHL repeat-containing protein [Nitrospiraceae bacterium]